MAVHTVLYPEQFSVWFRCRPNSVAPDDFTEYLWSWCGPRTIPFRQFGCIHAVLEAEAIHYYSHTSLNLSPPGPVNRSWHYSFH